MLYPFKFKPQLFHKLWGGHTIEKWYSDVPEDFENVGESWVISDIDRFPTPVANGPHAGDLLSDLIEVYMDLLVGARVYDTFGNQFPLLLKFIDSEDDLSIQVHPNDEYAMEHEDSMGKTEMWYVLPSRGNASIYLGWNQQMNASLIHSTIADGSLAEYLQLYKVHEGDVAFIAAGTVHAMRRDTIVAEIQENSDITYRLYDYNRVGNDGRKRPLKLDRALQVMDFSPRNEAYCISTHPRIDGAVNLCSSPYFVTNLLSPSRPIQRDYAPLDSFVAYMCVEGQCIIEALDCEDPSLASASLRLGEALLIPASINDIVISPQNGLCKLLEVYVDLK